MLLKIIDMISTNPYFNIAAEYRYYENARDEEIILLLWQNEPSVIIGRNQNIYREVNLSCIKNNDIKAVRRFTGGGAVYHDLGNLNFSIISTTINKDTDKRHEILIKALNKLGIAASREGRNDLVADGYKISGMAYIEDDDKFLIHGTLMLNLDLYALSKSLTPDISKFRGKGIESVRSRVINLIELNKDITINSLKESIINEFINSYGDHIKEIHKENKRDLIIENMIMSDERIYGKDESAEIKKTFYVENRKMDLDIWIKNSKISDVRIYTDSLKIDEIEKLRKSLINKKYEEIILDDIIKNYEI